jgi:ATP/maltotriose-dependent transcriptional regulator MalT
MTSSQGAAPDLDVLLATKLHVPGSIPGLVPRPRLAELLDEGLRRGLVLACAPAGYGKTALLADWARRGTRAVAWLSLDTADNDPARFWRYMAAALDRACPGIGERVGPLLGPPAPPSFERLLEALINEVAGQLGDGEALLILDDYHVISSEPVHASLRFLLDQRPPGLPVILASRSDPPLSLARHRARGQLAELRAAELRFTTAESATLLQQVAATSGQALSDAAVAALAARTEGWAAGLQLAGLSLRGKHDVAGFVAAFTGSHRYVLDYLTEEVLERQSEAVRSFLLETSVLERLSGPLCDAVTGRAGSQAMLEHVEQAGLFLAPLDEVRGWWRYHHLFADLLRARLHDERPGRVSQLHRTAAGWFEEHGVAEDAIRHAVAASEMTWAARIIEQYLDEVFYLRGEAATIQRWISALPDDVVRGRSRLLLAQAQIANASGRAVAAGQLLDAAEQASAGSAEESFEPTAGGVPSPLTDVAGGIAIERAYLAALRGDAETTADFASRALAEVGDGEQMLGSRARILLAVALRLRGQLAEAERVLVSGIPLWQAAGQHAVTAWGCYHLGQAQRGQGRLDAAVQTFQRALDITAVPDRPAQPAAGPAYVGLAQVAYQRNELDAALGHVNEGIALCQRFVHTVPLAEGLLTLAWIRQASGNTAGALDAVGEAMQAAPGPAGLLNPVPAQRAWLLLTQGDLAEAARWTQETGLGSGDDADYPKELGHLVLAQLLLAQERPGEALALLNRLHTAAVDQDRTGSVIEVGALRALALSATGNEAAAVTSLSETLSLACTQGYVRIFADKGPPMAALLARLVAARRAGDAAEAQVPLDCLARLQHALDADHSNADGAKRVVAVSGLVEQLTSRELEVMAMLAAGKPNQAIARELVVTVDTVKKHVSHVLGKLGAENRTEAVARARALGLIP